MIFNGSCLRDILISMSKFSSSRAHLFFVIIWPIFENPHSTTASAWGITTYIANKRWMLLYNTIQSLRRSSTVTGFFTLATAPSISVSRFLIDFFVKYLFAFFNNSSLLSECSLLRNSSRTLLFCELKWFF